MQSTLRARRLELELMLESHLPESRYSPALLSLMHEEDALLRGGVNCDDTGRAIDARLGKETSVFYTQVARQRAFKWGALLSKAHEPLPSAARVLIAPVHAASSMTEEQLEEESLRLETDYNERWLQLEGFNLEEAFRLQSLKMDAEYRGAEEALAARLRLRADPGAAEAADGRWHHPEKQRRLVHTAPVLCPTHPTDALADNSEALHQTRAALDGLALQKTQSKRWMRRQEIRIMATAGALEEERRCIARVLRQEGRARAQKEL